MCMARSQHTSRAELTLNYRAVHAGENSTVWEVIHGEGLHIGVGCLLIVQGKAGTNSDMIMGRVCTQVTGGAGMGVAFMILPAPRWRCIADMRVVNRTSRKAMTVVVLILKLMILLQGALVR